MRWTPGPRTNIEDRRGETPDSDSLLYGVHNKMQRLRQTQQGVGRRVSFAGEVGDMLTYTDENGNTFQVPRAVVGGQPAPQQPQPTPTPAPMPRVDTRGHTLEQLRRRLGLL